MGDQHKSELILLRPTGKRTSFYPLNKAETLVAIMSDEGGRIKRGDGDKGDSGQGHTHTPPRVK